MEEVLTQVLNDQSSFPILARRLKTSDAKALNILLNSQAPNDLDYFKPHDFDIPSINRQFRNCSFLMMGTFSEEKLTGYFFLRFFANRKCFVGRLIDKDHRGHGIGQVMNNIMYETAWRMNFRCLSTISRNNKAVMKSHSKNQSMVILKDLPNDYLLVEFVKDIGYKS